MATFGKRFVSALMNFCAKPPPRKTASCVVSSLSFEARVRASTARIRFAKALSPSSRRLVETTADFVHTQDFCVPTCAACSIFCAASTFVILLRLVLFYFKSRAVSSGGNHFSAASSPLSAISPSVATSHLCVAGFFASFRISIRLSNSDSTPALFFPRRSSAPILEIARYWPTP